MIAISECEGDGIVPDALSPGEGAIDRRREGFVDAITDRSDDRVKEHRNEYERNEREAKSVERDENEKEKERDPPDTGIGEEEGQTEDEDEDHTPEFFCQIFRKAGEEDDGDAGESGEIEAEDIGMAEGAEDARDGNILVLEPDAIHELIDAEENRKYGGAEQREKKNARIIARLHGRIREEADAPDAEESQELLDSENW